MRRQLGFLIAALIVAVGCSSQPGSEQAAAGQRIDTGADMHATSGPPPLSGDTVTTASGLKYIVIETGHGPAAKAGESVRVHYTGWLMDGRKFDSSLDRGQPFSFPGAIPPNATLIFDVELLGVGE